MFNIAQIDAMPITAQRLGQATCCDPILRKVWRFTRSGWPAGKVSECLKAYWHRRHELTIEGRCILWGTRVVVPKSLQEEVLAEVHRDHLGIVKMKAVA